MGEGFRFVKKMVGVTQGSPISRGIADMVLSVSSLWSLQVIYSVISFSNSDILLAKELRCWVADSAFIIF